jgi:site-specific DNA-cytosine methylase
MKRTHELLCLDLFAGAEGFSEGFRQAGFQSIAATDMDPWAGATFELNHARHRSKRGQHARSFCGVLSTLFQWESYKPRPSYSTV